MRTVLTADLSMEIGLGALSEQECYMLSFFAKEGSEWRIGIYRMNPSGPSMMIEAPHVTLDDGGKYHIPIWNKWPDGLYIAKIASLSLQNAESGVKSTAFWLGSERPEDLARALEDAEVEQKNFKEREVRLPGFQGDRRIFLHVLVDGCYLDYHQHFEGGYLSPLGHRLNPESIVSAINKILPEGVDFTDTALLNESYGREHPLCLVTFVNVQAPDSAEAANAVQDRLARVLAALSEDRGASPEIIAYLAEANGDFKLFTPSSIYRGNLIAGFGPSITGMLDLFEKAGENDPWIDFALGLMRTIRIQRNPESQLFQAWTFIESAAKRSTAWKDEVILDDAGAQLLDPRGKTLNQKTDFGRVIAYFRDNLGGGKISAANHLELLDAYKCRSKIAHEGGIAVPGSQSNPSYYPDLARKITDWASQALRHELVRAAKIDT